MSRAWGDERDRLIKVADALHDCERGCQAIGRTLADAAKETGTDSIGDLLFHTSSLMARIRYESESLEGGL